MPRLLIALVVGGLLANSALAQAPVELQVPAPELVERDADQWLNSPPLKLSELRGQVVVLHFWTFGCINCIHNQPHYKNWHEKYSKKGVTLIGVHTPETDADRQIKNVRRSVKETGLKFPIVFDGDGRDWNAWGNRWWPSTYLIDKRGVVRYRWDGELNWKETKGELMMRKRIDELLAEPGPDAEPREEAPPEKDKATPKVNASSSAGRSRRT